MFTPFPNKCVCVGWDRGKSMHSCNFVLTNPNNLFVSQEIYFSHFKNLKQYPAFQIMLTVGVFIFSSVSFLLALRIPKILKAPLSKVNFLLKNLKNLENIMSSFN